MIQSFNKNKILFLVPQIENRGPINVILNIISNLDLNKFDIMIISIRKIYNDYYEKFLPYCSLGIITTGISINQLDKLIEEFKIDIIHSHGFYPDKMVSNLKNKNIKKVTTIHCILSKDYIQEYGIIRGSLGTFLHLLFLCKKNNFTHVVACSNTIKKYLSTYINKKILFNINNGVNQKIYKQIDIKEKQKRKEQLNLNNKKVFIFAGRMIRRKQVPELISFFINFIKNQDSILLILGDGEEMQQCLLAAKNSSQQIQFLGQVDNPEYYYQIADFVISMSNAEGYPMSILEAVSCGCYALLSDIPSHREFITLNPECGNYLNNFNNSIYENNNEFNKFIDTYQLSAKLMAEKYTKIYLG